MTSGGTGIKSQQSSSSLVTSSTDTVSNVCSAIGSVVTSASAGTGSGSQPNYNISFIFADGNNKLAKNAKRQYESQVCTLHHVFGKVACYCAPVFFKQNDARRYIYRCCISVLSVCLHFR